MILDAAAAGSRRTSLSQTRTAMPSMNGTLKVYEKLSHGMCTTPSDVINADLLTFMKS